MQMAIIYGWRYDEVLELSMRYGDSTRTLLFLPLPVVALGLKLSEYRRRHQQRHLCRIGIIQLHSNNQFLASSLAVLRSVESRLRCSRKAMQVSHQGLHPLPLALSSLVAHGP